MKALVLFSALVAVSTGSVDRFTSQDAIRPTVSNIQLPLHSSPLTTGVAMIPKCFPYCPD